MSDEGIGVAVRRKEDARFLTGRGTYTDDINRPGQLHVYILRSPHAHAEIGGLDVTKAKQAAGVVAIFTGADLAAAAAPGARARPRAPRGRPRRGRDRREPQSGEGRRGAHLGQL
jgi:CO/xanthine dehydrogenase Mo-binding subunit